MKELSIKLLSVFCKESIARKEKKGRKIQTMRDFFEWSVEKKSRGDYAEEREIKNLFKPSEGTMAKKKAKKTARKIVKKAAPKRKAAKKRAVSK